MDSLNLAYFQGDNFYSTLVPVPIRAVRITGPYPIVVMTIEADVEVGTTRIVQGKET